jgi:hypothetical protein
MRSCITTEDREMAHFLDANQLAEELNALGLHDAEAALVAACEAAGEAIAAKRGIAFYDATNQPGFGGLCAGFGPINDGDKCPEDFADYDSSSDWASDDDAEAPGLGLK